MGGGGECLLKTWPHPADPRERSLGDLNLRGYRKKQQPEHQGGLSRGGWLYLCTSRSWTQDPTSPVTSPLGPTLWIRCSRKKDSRWSHLRPRKIRTHSLWIAFSSSPNTLPQFRSQTSPGPPVPTKGQQYRRARTGLGSGPSLHCSPTSSVMGGTCTMNSS